MDKPQPSFSLPRRLPRQPKAAPCPAENVAEDISLAPNISYFAEEIAAPAPPKPEVSIALPPPTPSEQQESPANAKVVQSTQIADSAPQEPTAAESAPIPALENRRNRSSHDDPKPGYARLSGPSRSRPSRPSAFTVAASPSASVPAVRETRNRGASEAREAALPRVSAEHPVTSSIPQEFQVATRSTASRASITAHSNDTAIPSAPISRIAKSANRRVARKRKMPAGIALTVLSCILVTYSFTVGSIENEVDRVIVNSESMPAFMKTMLPWLPLLPLVILLGIVLWILADMIGLRRTRHHVGTSITSDEQAAQQRETKRRKAPLERFRDEAEKEGIGKDAAYQAWRLLQMYGPDSHILSIYDDLHVTLSMTQQQIQSVYRQLAPSTERMASARSVLDLMRLANSPQRNTAPRQKSTR